MFNCSMSGIIISPAIFTSSLTANLEKRAQNMAAREVAGHGVEAVQKLADAARNGRNNLPGQSVLSEHDTRADEKLKQQQQEYGNNIIHSVINISADPSHAGHSIRKNMGDEVRDVTETKHLNLLAQMQDLWQNNCRAILVIIALTVLTTIISIFITVGLGAAGIKTSSSSCPACPSCPSALEIWTLFAQKGFEPFCRLKNDASISYTFSLPK